MTIEESILLLCVDKVEEEYLNNTEILDSVQGSTKPFPSSSLSPTTPCRHCTLSEAFSSFMTAVQETSKDTSSSIFFLIDDIHLLGDSDTSIITRVRELRHYIEDHFQV